MFGTGIEDVRNRNLRFCGYRDSRCLGTVKIFGVQVFKILGVQVCVHVCGDIAPWHAYTATH